MVIEIRIYVHKGISQDCTEADIDGDMSSVKGEKIKSSTPPYRLYPAPFCHHHGMKRLLPVLAGFVVLLLSSTEGWSLPPCPGSPSSYDYNATENWTNCEGTLTYDYGASYVGE